MVCSWCVFLAARATDMFREPRLGLKRSSDWKSVSNLSKPCEVSQAEWDKYFTHHWEDGVFSSQFSTQVGHWTKKSSFVTEWTLTPQPAAKDEIQQQPAESPSDAASALHTPQGKDTGSVPVEEQNPREDYNTWVGSIQDTGSVPVEETNAWEDYNPWVSLIQTAEEKEAHAVEGESMPAFHLLRPGIIHLLPAVMRASPHHQGHLACLVPTNVNVCLICFIVNLLLNLCCMLHCVCSLDNFNCLIALVALSSSDSVSKSK